MRWRTGDLEELAHREVQQGAVEIVAHYEDFRGETYHGVRVTRCHEAAGGRRGELFSWRDPARSKEVSDGGGA